MKLLAAAIAFVGGTLLGFGLGDAVTLAAALFAIAALLGALLLASLRRSPWIALAALAFALGMARALIGGGDDAAEARALISDRTQEIEGVVVRGDEAAGAFARFRLQAERIRPINGEWTAADALILVTARADADMAQRRQAPYFRYGDRLRLTGRIQAPPALEDFDYPAYLARQGVFAVMYARRATLVSAGNGSGFYRWLYGLRRSAAASIAAVVPEPQAALAQAMVLGLRGGIPDDVTTAFRRSGAAHLLAISGLHVGILLTTGLSVSAALLGRKRYLHLIAPLALIWLYALLSGMSPSAARACIMGSVYLAALAAGRQRGALAALGCAAAVMVGVSPNIIFSISFQLSFAALAGIAALGDGFGGLLRGLAANRLGWRSPLRPVLTAAADMVGVTVAATAATLPLIAYHFEQVSTLGIPATLLTLPAVPPFIIGSGAAGLLGMASESLALPFGWVAWGAGAYVTGVVTALSELPSAAVNTGRLPLAAVVGCYLILAALCLPSVAFPNRLRALWRRIGLPSVSPAVVLPQSAGLGAWLIVPAAFAAALVWSDALLARDDRLHIHFVDVGQGDGVFIETPGGVQVVIDGGADPLRMTQFLAERMRFNDTQIDLVVATHAHSDHVGGLAQILARYEVAGILERRIAYDSAPYTEWRRAADSEGAANIEAHQSQAIALDNGIRLEVLWPPQTLMRGSQSDVDNASVVLRLVYGDVSALLTGDIYGDAERALLAGGVSLDVDALKVAHHGSGDSSTEAFLLAASPSAAVISVGADNRFGHPSADVMERLGRFVAPEMLFTTAERGTVEFITDGKRLWARAER